jgi:hypothetical protein
MGIELLVVIRKNRNRTFFLAFKIRRFVPSSKAISTDHCKSIDHAYEVQSKLSIIQIKDSPKMVEI